MAKKTESLIAFRSTLPAKLPPSPLVASMAIGPGLIWTMGDAAEYGGLQIPEGRVRKTPKLYGLWDDFPRVQNRVSRHTSWELWWGSDLSMIDFINKENDIQWIQTKTRQQLNSGKRVALVAGLEIGLSRVTREEILKFLKAPKT